MKSLAPEVSQLDEGLSFVQQIESVNPANLVQSVGPLDVYGTWDCGSRNWVSKLFNLLGDIAQAESSNSKADVALASLTSPTDGIVLTGEKCDLHNWRGIKIKHTVRYLN